MAGWKKRHPRCLLAEVRYGLWGCLRPGFELHSHSWQPLPSLLRKARGGWGLSSVSPKFQTLPLLRPGCPWAPAVSGRVSSVPGMGSAGVSPGTGPAPLRPQAGVRVRVGVGVRLRLRRSPPAQSEEGRAAPPHQPLDPPHTDLRPRRFPPGPRPPPVGAGQAPPPIGSKKRHSRGPRRPFPEPNGLGGHTHGEAAPPGLLPISR